MVAQADINALVARIEKAQSVGATVLSNMTAVKKQATAETRLPQAEVDALVARASKAQSVGATILSTMSAAKKQVLAWPVDPVPAATAGLVLAPMKGAQHA